MYCRTYTTSGSDRYNWDDAIDFCQSQHTSGLVTWDSEEKYKDVKFIVNRDGENKHAYTALYNKDEVQCYWADGCDGQLVSGMKMYSMNSVRLKVNIAVLETK